MSDWILFRFPPEVSIVDEEEVLEFFRILASENDEELLQVLDTEPEALDRNRACLDKIAITTVIATNKEITLEVELEFSQGQGCRDMTSTESIFRSVVGRVNTRGWEFKRHIPLDRRSTADEL